MGKQKEKEPPELAASGETTDEKKPSKGKNMMSPKELEMAAYATGRKVEELMKMTKKEVRTLIMEVVAGSKSKKRSRSRDKSRSRSRSKSRKDEDKGKSKSRKSRSRSRS